MKANEIYLIDCIMAQLGLNLTQLVQLSEILQTTVHRTLGNLCRHRLLLKNGENYFLGPVFLRWINSSMLDLNERYAQVIRPHLVELAQATGEIIHLVQREGSGPISLKSKIEHKLQLYCTGAGRALLTLFSREELLMGF